MSPEQMTEIIEGRSTVSDKIRALNAAGVPRADIARFLGKRYQHVRNVLEGDAAADPGHLLGRADLSGVREADKRFEIDSEGAYEARGGGVFRLKVREDGSIVLPPSALQRLALRSGDGVIARIDHDSFTVISNARAMREAQALVQARLAPGGSMADELIADRRREAKRDEADD